MINEIQVSGYFWIRDQLFLSFTRISQIRQRIRLSVDGKSGYMYFRIRWRSKIVSSLLPNNKPIWRHDRRGSRVGEMGEFSPPPPFSEPPSSFFSYSSHIEIIFDFSDIITKIHPPFQNLGSALARPNYYWLNPKIISDTWKIFGSRKKKLQIQNYPNTCGRGQKRRLQML